MAGALENLASIEVAWSKPWVIAAGCHIGTRHYAAGKPMQDSMRYGSYGNCIWLIISDGVSDSKFAADGSKLAVDVLGAHIENALRRGAQPSTEIVRTGFAAVHAAIAQEATKMKARAKDFRATLAAVIIDGESDIYAGNVGDSSVLIATNLPRDGKPALRLTSLCPTALPINELNSSVTVADPEWTDTSTFHESHTTALQAVFLGSDGADTFFSAPESRFSPRRMNQFLAALDDPKNFKALPDYASVMAWYFKGEPAKDEDDRSIILALKIPDKHQPPTPKTK